MADSLATRMKRPRAADRRPEPQALQPDGSRRWRSLPPVSMATGESRRSRSTRVAMVLAIEPPGEPVHTDSIVGAHTIELQRFAPTALNRGPSVEGLRSRGPSSAPSCGSRRRSSGHRGRDRPRARRSDRDPDAAGRRWRHSIRSRGPCAALERVRIAGRRGERAGHGAAGLEGQGRVHPILEQRWLAHRRDRSAFDEWIIAAGPVGDRRTEHRRIVARQPLQRSGHHLADAPPAVARERQQLHRIVEGQHTAHGKARRRRSSRAPGAVSGVSELGEPIREAQIRPGAGSPDPSRRTCSRVSRSSLARSCSRAHGTTRGAQHAGLAGRRSIRAEAQSSSSSSSSLVLVLRRPTRSRRRRPRWARRSRRPRRAPRSRRPRSPRPRWSSLSLGAPPSG